VFTWDPTGGYGHPDHIACHKHTITAFESAGDARQFPESGEPWSPSRLYWGAFTMKRFAGMYLELQKRGLMPEGIDPERRERFEKAMSEPDPPVTHTVDVRDVVALKRRASSMHKSQFGENSMMARIPEDMREMFYGEERFLQARPPVGENSATFEGLDSLLPDDLA